MAKATREVTNPRTDDEDEARRQLRERQSEQGYQRRRRARVQDRTVANVLNLFVKDRFDKHKDMRLKKVIAWIAALGTVQAIELETEDVKDVLRRWARRGTSWPAGSMQLPDESEIAWPARPTERMKPLDGATLNRHVAVLRRAYKLAREEWGLMTAVTWPKHPERKRGQFFSEAEIAAIVTNYQTREGKEVKADVFHLACLLGVRSTQLRMTTKANVIITDRGTPKESWILKWTAYQTKNGEEHEILLSPFPDALAIVQRNWGKRLPDCDLLFHVAGRPLGNQRSELRRTCAHLGISYGRKHGKVFHDSRHTAKTNLTEAGVPDEVAMTVTGHKDVSVFKSYHVRRKQQQAEALRRLQDHLNQNRPAASGRGGSS
jgi:hypothetical protein